MIQTYHAVVETLHGRVSVGIENTYQEAMDRARFNSSEMGDVQCYSAIRSDLFDCAEYDPMFANMYRAYWSGGKGIREQYGEIGSIFLKYIYSTSIIGKKHKSKAHRWSRYRDDQLARIARKKKMAADNE